MDGLIGLSAMRNAAHYGEDYIIRPVIELPNIVLILFS